MLAHLTIRNYALIRHLELSLSKGLSVITGETGAGKSILLGAIGLLTGNRADTKVLWDSEDKCVAEGEFEIGEYKLQSLFKAEDLDYSDRTLIRREISPAGKSRAFINDTPVTLEVLRKIGTRLMDIHSQHETLLIGNEDFQLRLIDSFAGNEALTETYLNHWNICQEARLRYEKISKEAGALRAEADFIHFQLNELSSLHLQPGEQLSLESELKVMEHAEDIKSKLNQSLQILNMSEYATRASLAEARALIQSIRSLSPSYHTLADRLDSSLIELDDIVQELETAESRVVVDPERAQLVQDRLSHIYKLQKKHRLNTVDELLALQTELQRKADLTTNLDETVERCKSDWQVAKKQLDASASKVTASRKKVLPELVKALEELLREVGIPDAKILIQLDAIDPEPSGADAVAILFSANKGIAPKLLTQVASGGEFSRLMFCIKYILAARKSLPTLLLDEIDNGISGEIAVKVGQLMRRMSSRHQILAITHLPQIAAQGSDHFFVYKDSTSKKTVTNIRRLTADERVQEIAQMLSGASPSRSALASARELLAINE